MQVFLLNRMRPGSVNTCKRLSPSPGKGIHNNVPRPIESEARRGRRPTSPSAYVSGAQEAVADKGSSPGSAKPCPRGQSKDSGTETDRRTDFGPKAT